MNGDPVNNPPSLTEPSARAASVPNASPAAAPQPPAPSLPAPVSQPPQQPVSAPVQPVAPSVSPLPPAQAVVASATVSPPRPPIARAVTSEAASTEGFYHPETTVAEADPSAGDDLRPGATPQRREAPASVSWTSSGDMLQTHAAAWRTRMIVVSVVLGAIIFLLTRDWISSGAVVLAGIIFGFLGGRTPAGITYEIDTRGIAIGQKMYSYGDLRAFSVVDDQMGSNIELIPLKRFMPAVSIHFEQAQQQQIVDALSAYLPMQAHRQDMVDHIINRIKL